jgi:hypothetical protein
MPRLANDVNTTEIRRAAVHAGRLLVRAPNQSPQRSGRNMSVQSTLAPLRRFPSRFRGGFSLRRRDRGVRRPMAVGFRHDGDVQYQRYQFKYQQAQQRPPGTTQGHTGPTRYHQKASEIPWHTPRTKAAAGKRRIHEGAMAIGSHMAGNLFPTTQDHDLLDSTPTRTSWNP